MKKLITLLFFFLLISCEKDFIVKDIKNKSIKVIAPKDDLKTTNNLITFWWEELDGAEKYNLQIVKPSFSSVTNIILDTNITSTKFSLSLNPGNYQWRIRATNAGGSNHFQTYNLMIDTTSDLSSIVPIPLLPLSGFNTYNPLINFSWSSVDEADYYKIEVNNGSAFSATTTGTTYTYSLSALIGGNTVYTWRVKAFNEFSLSQYSTPQTFTIDLLSPAAPFLISPTHGSYIKDTVKLKWNRSGAPDAVRDSIFVATDSLFTNIISRTRTWQQSIRVNQLSTPPNLNDVIYWWKLKSIDSAGNRSTFSTQLKFKLSTP